MLQSVVQSLLFLFSSASMNAEQSAIVPLQLSQSFTALDGAHSAFEHPQLVPQTRQHLINALYPPLPATCPAGSKRRQFIRPMQLQHMRMITFRLP